MPKIHKKKNSIPFTCIFFIILVSVFILSLSPPAIIEVYNQSHSNIPVGEIYGNRKIGQTLVADHDNLSAIEILLATYNRKNTGTFVFRLRKGLKSEDDVYLCKVNMREVQDNSFFRFSIPRIENYKGEEILLKKGEEYYFCLESPGAEPGNAITIWSNSEDLYKNGEKTINGVPSQGDLVFKTKYALGWRLSFHALPTKLMTILNFFLNLFKNQVFYFVILLMLFVWAFITFVKKFEIFQKKGGVFLVFGTVFIAVSLGIILLLVKKIEVYNQFDHTDTVGKIFREKKVGQTFIAQYDHLMAIEVLMGTYQRKNPSELIFHMKGQGGNRIDLYHSRVNMLKIRDNRYHRFKIPEIKNSQDQKYYFYIEAPNAQPGNAITIWCNNEEDKYKEGTKIINGKETGGDLAFKTIYAVGLQGKTDLFLGEITRNKSLPLNKKWFYIGLIVTFVLTCSLFLTYIIRIFVETHTANKKKTNNKS